MASLPGDFTLQAFSDAGALLASGRLYTYAYGLTTHKPAFTDAAGLVPHTYTSDGAGGQYIALNARGELPAPLYLAAGSYDIALKRPDGSTVWTRRADPVADGADAATAAATALRADLASSSTGKGAALVGFQAAGSGAVARLALDKLRDAVSVKDFGAKGDGTTNDRAAILLAFAASRHVVFPAGTYYLGTASGGTPLLDLRALGDDVSIQTDGYVKLVGQTVTDTEQAFILFKNQSHVSIGELRFEDTGFIPGQGSPRRGLICVAVECGNASFGNMHIRGIYGKNVAAGFATYNTADNLSPSANRFRGIQIDFMFVDGGYYGVNLSDNGDGLRINRLVTFAVFRSYFVFGVSGHDVDIFARAGLAASGNVNICRQVSGLSTTAIRVKYTARDFAAAVSHVLINHIDTTASGAIDGVVLDLDIQDANPLGPAVKFVTYTGSGGVETSAPTANIVTNVMITGRAASTLNNITSTANYTTPGRLNIATTSIALDTASIPQNFALSSVLSYTPAWTAAVTNPAIGNGTISGKYSVHAGMAHVAIDVTMGSTTTFGNGFWSFALPIAPKVTNGHGSARALSSGVAWFVGEVSASGYTCQLTFNNSTTQAGGAIPFTWKSGDTLSLAVSYPV
jgi:hypothetical protein